MKRFPFLASLLMMLSIFFLVSCGSNETASSDQTTDTTAATPTETTPVSTITTTPLNIMVATHKVKDFASWKSSYDAHDSLRLANGVHSFTIGRGDKDPNMVRVVVRVDDIDKAKSFSKNPDLKQAMQKGGVTGTPTFKFYTLVFRDSAQNKINLRSATTITVKDWNTWQKSFDSTRQLGTDNGLSTLGYGHEIDDNHKVLIVSAILDTAKANAYWNSDLLKQRRAASGAGEPTRFIFNRVQQY